MYMIMRNGCLISIALFGLVMQSVSINKRLDIIQKMRCILPRSCIEKLYKSFIRSLLDYTDVIYDNCSKFDTDKLEHVQRRACIIATGAIRLTKHETLLQEVGLETLKSRRRHHRLV